MKMARLVNALIPQLLPLLLVLAAFDLLGGWNQTDGAMTVLLLLFVAAPGVTLAWLVVEVVTYRLDRRRNGSRSSRPVKFAIVLFIESLLINLFLLSQLRMH